MTKSSIKLLDKFGLAVMVAFTIIVGLSGCSTSDYKRRADREAAQLIAEKSPSVPNMDPDFELVDLDPVVLDALPEFTKREVFLGPTGESEIGARVISLEKAIEFATIYNRNYLTQKDL